MTIHMNLGEDSYDIIVERGILDKANQYLNLKRRVLIVTDSGVPSEYAETLSAQCKNGIIYTVKQGESSKSLDIFGKLLQTMLDYGFSRKDCVVAVGGGVVGDVSGFAASAAGVSGVCTAVSSATAVLVSSISTSYFTGVMYILFYYSIFRRKLQLHRSRLSAAFFSACFACSFSYLLYAKIIFWTR